MSDDDSDFIFSDEEVLSSPKAERDLEFDVDKIQFDINNKPPGFDTWAPCKQQSWMSLKDNPNAFFYRHVLPGTKQKNGPWSEDEKQLFLKTLKEYPVQSNGRWGLFARLIPGRVGYQCNAFFKKLLAAGEIPGMEPPPPKEPKEKASKSDSGDESGDKQARHRARPKYSKEMDFDYLMSVTLSNYKGTDFSFMHSLESAAPSYSIPKTQMEGNPPKWASLLSSPKAVEQFRLVTHPLFA